MFPQQTEGSVLMQEVHLPEEAADYKMLHCQPLKKEHHQILYPENPRATMHSLPERGRRYCLGLILFLKSFSKSITFEPESWQPSTQTQIGEA
jgi:hypothetical protein